jgi:hypothetical protein
MTRLSGILDKIAAPTAPAAIEVKMNGGNF